VFILYGSGSRISKKKLIQILRLRTPHFSENFLIISGFFIIFICIPNIGDEGRGEEPSEVFVVPGVVDR
jgi:hypothetical protein